MTGFLGLMGCCLGLLLPALAASAEQAKKPVHVLFCGPRQWMTSDVTAFFEAMTEHSHPDWDVRCILEQGDGQYPARREDSAGSEAFKAWIGHDVAGMTADLDARIQRVESAIKMRTPRDPAKQTPAGAEQVEALKAKLANFQAQRAELAQRKGWDYVFIGTIAPPEFQAEMVDLALAKGFKTYLLLPFGFEAHGYYYGDSHYMPVKSILPKEVAAARAAKAPVVSSALSFGTLFQTTGEKKGPYQFYYASKFTWMGAYVLACQIHTTLFNVSPVGAWSPSTLPESATRFKHMLQPAEGPTAFFELPLKPEYIKQMQEQAWTTHQAFTAALAQPAPPPATKDSQGQKSKPSP